MKIFSAILFGAVLSILVCRAGASETWPEWRAPMLAKFAEDLKAIDAALAATPDAIPLFSRRGDCHLFLGHFREAVADYERMIQLNPAELPQVRGGGGQSFMWQVARLHWERLKTGNAPR